MRLQILALSSLVLAGCADPLPKPDNIVYVKQPVPCKITPVAKPTMPYDSVKPEDSALTKVKAALAEIERRIGYETQLEAAINECNK